MIKTVILRTLYVLVLLACVAILGGIGLLLETKQYVYQNIQPIQREQTETTPFPVSVDPAAQTISNIDLLNANGIETLAQTETPRDSWLHKAIVLLSQKGWYQNLASPVSRIIVIWPGERREEVAEHIGTILRWDKAAQAEFLTLIEETEPVLEEGKLYPGEYVVHRGATPAEVAMLIEDKFNERVIDRYTSDVASKVPLEDALIIASLLEREASDFENMREISGVIWNRLFIDMPLQLDATLQYAKANTTETTTWWPAPRPADKFIKSPFNTYANKGLPPGAIANPSTASIIAALNPLKTTCLYYFHSAKGEYYCSETYPEHVEKLKQVYGRGR